MKKMTLVCFLVAFSSSVNAQFSLMEKWTNRLWEVELSNSGIKGFECIARTFQRGHTLTLTADVTGNYILTFFVRGVVENRWTNLLINFDGVETVISARTQNTQGETFIALIDLGRDPSHLLMINNLKFSTRIIVSKQGSGLASSWSLAGSSVALTVLGNCATEIVSR